MRLTFSIINPFYKGKTETKTYFELDEKISENKNLEIQVSKFEAYDLFDFRLNLCWFGDDHAGPSFLIEVLGYHFSIGIYDSRHWDYDKHQWEKSE